jgi:hypothetical protein
LILASTGRKERRSRITNELAIKILIGDVLGTPEQTQEAVTMAVKALSQPETAKRIIGKSRGGITLWYQCEMCNEPVDAQDNFCRRCGRRLTDG